MAPTRNLPKLLLLCFALFALLAPSALAAEGIGPGKPLGGSKTTTSTATASGSKTTSGNGTSGSSKEALSVGTVAPINGTKVSGTIAWQVAVTAGSPSKIEFLVDGAAGFSDSSAPYSGTLDTTKLTNGNHTLSATAYGSRGVRTTTSVTVTVANNTPAPAPAPEPELPSEPLPETGTGAPVYWGATIGNQFTGTPAPWDMAPVSK